MEYFIRKIKENWYMYISFMRLVGIVALGFSLFGEWAAAVSVNVPETLPASPVRFIRGALMDRNGAIWTVGEQAGVHRLNVNGRGYETSWQNMDYFHGFPKTKNFTCIAEDGKGRIWVGTDDRGVAVFNGQKWEVYDRRNALNGEHVYSIAVSPVSGEVAVATSGGVAVYDPARDAWKMLDRSCGLAADQAAAAGFDSKGNLWLAYDFGGVSCSSRKSGYMQTKTVQAPWFWDQNQFVREPYQPYGDGLPSNACNVLNCLDNDQVLVGTCAGLAFNNGISSWRFMRGLDYAQKNNNFYGSGARKTAIPAKRNSRLVSEDFVSAIVQQGKEIFVGFRTQGVDVLDAGTMEVKERLRKGLEGSHISDLLVLRDGSVLAGTYGSGLVPVRKGKLTYQLEKPEVEDEIAFPSLPRMEKSADVLQRLEKLGQRGDTGRSIVFRGEDWATKGDWCGKYGTTHSVLCATNAPMGNSMFEAKTVPHYPLMSVPGHPGYRTSLSSYWIQGMMGLNRSKGDALRWWVESIHNEGNRNVLFDPTDSTRTEAEWDDHGEEYPAFIDGPDIWVAVEVPEGVHEIALYFYNPNGYLRNESRRDYLIEVRRYSPPSPLLFVVNNKTDIAIGERSKIGLTVAALMEKWHAIPVEARARVSRFAGSGVYKRFMSKKGGVYLFRICRNGSFNTILNGVFVNENIPWETRLPEELPYYVAGEFAGIIPTPDKVNKSVLGENHKKVLKPLYDLQYTRKYLTPAGCSLQNRYLLSMWREAVEQKKDKCTVDCLQWETRVTDPVVQASFDETMKRSWDQSQFYYICNRSREAVPNAPGTIPFSLQEVRMMAKLRIDWKQYRNDATTLPEKSVKEMKEYLKQELLKQQKAKKNNE